ncbi:MAG: hypothetical protein AAGJ73_07885 [Pseudomonadota bacterium]
MSADELIAERYAPEDPNGDDTPVERAIASPLKRLASKPLLPEAGAGGAPLTAVIGVMSFLATMAFAAFIVIASATTAWTEELRTAFTVQIKAADAETIAANTQEAVRILQSVEGVTEVSVIEPEEAAKLLEPWLGKGNIGDYLNVPAIIEVTAKDAVRADLELLQSRLSAAAPGAVIDDHGEWHGRLSSAAQSGALMAFFVFALVMGAACAIAIFAARAGLAANENVVSLLHLVGATDQFIANEVQRRFVILGLRGALGGAVVAVLALVLSGAAMQSGGEGRFFLPDFALNGWSALLLLIAPLLICVVTAVSARMTVLKSLRSAY